MKKFLILGFLFFYGCGGGGGGTSNSVSPSSTLEPQLTVLDMKIMNWQDKESTCTLKDDFKIDKTFPLVDQLLQVVFHVNEIGFTQWPEKFDYWKSSCEALEDLVGDCEDVAALIHIILKKNGIESDIVIIENRFYQHAVVMVEDWSDWIIDYNRMWVVDQKSYFDFTETKIVDLYRSE